MEEVGEDNDSSPHTHIIRLMNAIEVQSFSVKHMSFCLRLISIGQFEAIETKRRIVKRVALTYAIECIVCE